MKKIFAVLALLTLTGFVFAQSSADAYVDPKDTLEKNQFIDNEKLSSVIITPEDQHLYDMNASIFFEYKPLYDELIVYYDTYMSSFDEGEALNTAIACLEDFMKAKEYTADGVTKAKTVYSRYVKTRIDRTKNYKDKKGIRRTQFVSYIKFTR